MIELTMLTTASLDKNSCEKRNSGFTGYVAVSMGEVFLTSVAVKVSYLFCWHEKVLKS